MTATIIRCRARTSREKVVMHVFTFAYRADFTNPWGAEASHVLSDHREFSCYFGKRINQTPALFADLYGAIVPFKGSKDRRQSGYLKRVPFVRPVGCRTWLKLAEHHEV